MSVKLGDAVSSPARVATKAGERSAKIESDDVIAVHLYSNSCIYI